MKKDKIITIRVSEKEKRKLIEKSEIAKLSLSEYLIKQGLDKDIVMVDGLNEVVAELRRIGNNINQYIFTFCLVLKQSKLKCNAVKIKCRYRFSIMSIKRLRFYDQTFAFL